MHNFLLIICILQKKMEASMLFALALCPSRRFSERKFVLTMEIATHSESISASLLGLMEFLTINRELSGCWLNQLWEHSEKFLLIEMLVKPRCMPHGPYAASTVTYSCNSVSRNEKDFFGIS